MKKAIKRFTAVTAALLSAVLFFGVFSSPASAASVVTYSLTRPELSDMSLNYSSPTMTLVKRDGNYTDLSLPGSGSFSVIFRFIFPTPIKVYGGQVLKCNAVSVLDSSSFGSLIWNSHSYRFFGQNGSSFGVVGSLVGGATYPKGWSGNPWNFSTDVPMDDYITGVDVSFGCTGAPSLFLGVFGLRSLSLYVSIPDGVVVSEAINDQTDELTNGWTPDSGAEDAFDQGKADIGQSEELSNELGALIPKNEAENALGGAAGNANTLFGGAQFVLAMTFIQRTVGGIFNGTPLFLVVGFVLCVVVVCYLIGNAARIASIGSRGGSSGPRSTSKKE